MSDAGAEGLVGLRAGVAKSGREQAVARARVRGAFYFWMATAMSLTVVVGFWFTYFQPLFRGAYPQSSAMLHIHGWSFFAWYPLLMIETALIRSRRVNLHRTLGLMSISLGAIMIGVGFLVSVVRVETATGPEPDPFWALMGMPIFSIWLLFTGFYIAAIVLRKRSAAHKRLMMVASAAALSAATFRVFVVILGFEVWVAVIGTLSPVLFMIAGMLHDLRGERRIHPVWLMGVSAMLVLTGGAFLLGSIPGGDSVTEAVAWVGRKLLPLY